MSSQEMMRAEIDVLTITGISQADLRVYRKNVLQQGLHWIRTSGRVFYTPGGIEKLCRAVGADFKAVSDQPNKKTADLIVTRTGFRNRQIIEARHPGGEIVRLKVRDGKNFLAGMIVPACLLIDEDLWEYVGKMPRARGVW